jgi:hypothetical protein
MWVVRHALPAAIVLAGLLILALAKPPVSIEGGCTVIGAGLALWLLNWLHRVGVAGESDRDREEEARRYFDEHGRWPGE